MLDKLVAASKLRLFVLSRGLQPAIWRISNISAPDFRAIRVRVRLLAAVTKNNVMEQLDNDTFSMEAKLAVSQEN